MICGICHRQSPLLKKLFFLNGLEACMNPTMTTHGDSCYIFLSYLHYSFFFFFVAVVVLGWFEYLFLVRLVNKWPTQISCLQLILYWFCMYVDNEYQVLPLFYRFMIGYFYSIFEYEIYHMCYILQHQLQLVKHWIPLIARKRYLLSFWNDFDC